MSERIADLVVRLEAIGSDLDDAAFDVLQEAVSAGATRRPAIDKPLTQARRAVEKAIAALETAQSIDEA